MAHAQVAEVGHDRPGVAEGEILVELKAVGGFREAAAGDLTRDFGQQALGRFVERIGCHGAS